MRNHKNVNWRLPEGVVTWEQAQMAVLQDIRDELQTLNNVFKCYRFLAIPGTLVEIQRNTARKRRRKAKR